HLRPIRIHPKRNRELLLPLNHGLRGLDIPLAMIAQRPAAVALGDELNIDAHAVVLVAAQIAHVGLALLFKNGVGVAAPVKGGLLQQCLGCGLWDRSDSRSFQVSADDYAKAASGAYVVVRIKPMPSAAADRPVGCKPGAAPNHSACWKR